MPNKLALPIALVAVIALAACDDGSPAEVVTSTDTFPATGSWSATVAPVGTSTVRGTLALKQYAGFRMSATMTITGAPNTTYQWRMFRDPCTSNAPAATTTSATGLMLISTHQAYTDVRTDASGSGTVTATVSGVLDSLTSYSTRIRPGQTAITWNGTSPIACGDMKRTGGG